MRRDRATLPPCPALPGEAEVVEGGDRVRGGRAAVVLGGEGRLGDDCVASWTPEASPGLSCMSPSLGRPPAITQTQRVMPSDHHAQAPHATEEVAHEYGMCRVRRHSRLALCAVRAGDKNRATGGECTCCTCMRSRYAVRAASISRCSHSASNSASRRFQRHRSFCR